MAGRPKFTPEQLQVGGNHLLYGVAQLCNNAALLLDGDQWTGIGWRSKALEMAVLESFLVAADFCPPGWTAKRWKGFNQERDKISANLEHLSIDRPPVGEMWEYTRLRDDLMAMLLAFLDAADDRLSQRQKDAIRGVLNGAHVAVADTAPRDAR